MSFGLNENIISKFHSVFGKYPEIESVIIYGSRAKGNFREGSDIDITLVGPLLSEPIKSKVWLDLDALDTPYLIDISIYHLLSSTSLKEHIDRVGKIFYQKTSDI